MKSKIKVTADFRLILGLSVSLVFFLWAGTQSFWTDSEMWSASVVKYLFTGHPSYNFAIKPLFDSILYVNFNIAKLIDVHPMQTGRILFAINAAFSVFLCFRLIRKWGNNVAITCLFIFFWITDSFFIKRVTHVRSDLVIMTLVLLLFWFRSFSRWERIGPGLRFLVVCVVGLLGFLVTPKAVLFIGLWGGIFLLKDLKSLVATRNSIIAIASVLAASLILLFFSGLHDSAMFFVNSFSAKYIGISYFSFYRFEHVNRFFLQNALFIFLSVLNLYFGFFRRKDVPDKIRPVFDYGNGIFFLMMVYPDRLPFFIVALTPFFILPLAAFWPHLQLITKLSEKTVRRMKVLVFIFSMISGIYWSAFSLIAHNSKDQLTFVHWIGDKKDQLKGLQVYDVVGVLPFEEVHHWFLGPGEDHNADVIRRMQEESVDVVIGASKLGLLGQPIWQILEEKYWNDGAALFIRRWKVPLKGNSISREDLERTLLDLMPYLQNQPKHRVHLNLIAPGGVSLTRYARWQKDGIEDSIPFAADFSLEELRGYKKLLLPPTVDQAEILPIMLRTPFSKNWIELFRFDTEI